MQNIKCYENLANAVVEQAVADYKEAIKKYIRPTSKTCDKNKHKYLDTIRECEIFFESPMYALCTDVDGRWLRAEVKELAYEEIVKMYEKLFEKVEES